jgi:hypothetical protein
MGNSACGLGDVVTKETLVGTANVTSGGIIFKGIVGDLASVAS